MHTITRIHSRFLYPYPSFLLYESRPHDDHIYVHVHVDVLHRRQVVLYTDLGVLLPLHISTPNQILALCLQRA
jgi:hypothetical protein